MLSRLRGQSLSDYRDSRRFLLKASLCLTLMLCAYILAANAWPPASLPTWGMEPVVALSFLVIALSLNAQTQGRIRQSILFLSLLLIAPGIMALIFQAPAAGSNRSPWLALPPFSSIIIISSFAAAILLTATRIKACNRAAILIAGVVTGTGLMPLVGNHLPSITKLVTPACGLFTVLLGMASIGASHEIGWRGGVTPPSVEGPALRLIFSLALLGPVVLGVIDFHLMSYGMLQPEIITIVIVCAHIAFSILLLFWAWGRIGRGFTARQALTRALDAAPVAITDLNGRILYWSKGCEALYGWTAANAYDRQKRSLLSIPHETTEPIFPQNGTDIQELDLIERGADGSLLHIREQARPLGVDADGKQLVALVMSDITDKHIAQTRQAEMREELLHASRLSAIGEAAAGLAHELRQPLATTTNFLGIAELMLNSGDTDREQLRATIMLASEQALRAGEIARQFQAFLTKTPPATQPEPIEETIQGSIDLAITGMKSKTISVIYHHRTTHRFMLANRVQIQQIMLNLIRNAIEAQASDSGKIQPITLSTDDAEPGMVRISVRDQGSGIAEEVLRASYRPFISTKSDGMGLGLSICRRIVEFHGGSIHAENAPDGGALLWFTIPAVTNPAALAS